MGGNLRFAIISLPKLHNTVSMDNLGWIQGNRIGSQRLIILSSMIESSFMPIFCRPGTSMAS